MDEQPYTITFPCLKVVQPIGEFYIGSIPASELCDITYFDVRKILKEKRELDTYLGIQRELNKNRVKEIGEYVNTIDACFPTAVILAVPAACAKFDEDTGQMSLSNFFDEQQPENNVLFRDIAKVLDGQHRIEGLRNFKGPQFDVNVSIFVDADLAEQAYIFSTVNLAQTKVNKSLVYDLFDLAKARSPQKVCHNIAVALDQIESSPFYRRIKRLGTATVGRKGETLTQATFVQALLRYISKEPMKDRDLYMRGDTPRKASDKEAESLIFRNMLIDEKDMDIADILFNYFSAVRQKWPIAWDEAPRGNVLPRTNGFRALMRVLHPLYLRLTDPGGVPSVDEFRGELEAIQLNDEEFSVDNFKPGSSGESELYQLLMGYISQER